jgi:uncharacterized membrane protein YeiH
MIEVTEFVYYADLAGIAVFAATGVLAAQGRQIDMFGVIVLAIVTALGGGTLRDLCLNAHPLIWIADPVLLWTAVIAALFTFAVCRYRPYPRRALLTLDAAGLALFAVAGAEKALSLGFTPTIAVVMAVVTGCAGGMIRDLMTVRIPGILRHDEFYATCALLGAIFYVSLHGVIESGLLALITLAIIFTVRMLAIVLELRLPVFVLAGMDHPPRLPRLLRRLLKKPKHPED